MEPQPAGALELTADEKTMASLAHILQLVGWWIAPLVIFLVKRESKFVSFHALQALFLQIAIMMLWCIGIVAFVAAMFATIPSTPQPHGPPPAIVFLFPVFWVLAMGAWFVMMVVAIVYGIKAGRGEWASYTLLGDLARRALHL